MRKPALAAGLPLDASSVWNGDAVKDAGGTLVGEIRFIAFCFCAIITRNFRM